MTTTPVELSQPKVYLIDDDPVSTFLLVDLVESIGLPYAVYENAVKFLEEDLHGLQGCIVSDLRMPVISGLDLQDELHKRGVNLPMIFISASLLEGMISRIFDVLRSMLISIRRPAVCICS